MDPILFTLILCGLFCLGAAVGGQLNRGIYGLAWHPRAISPWGRPPAEAPPRRGFDRVPILGWLTLRREAALHGRGFWVRPLLIELATALGFAWLYWYAVVQGRIYDVPGVVAPGPATLHAQYLAHLVLIGLMIVATFIDFDEQTIPDAITIPGTLAGLLFAAVLPASLPLVPQYGIAPYHLMPLNVASPLSWPDWIDGLGGLGVGLLCLWAWCFAIIPWTWTTRRGWSKAVAYLFASIRRRDTTKMAAAIAVVGGVGVLTVWLMGDLRWRCLYTALVGMAFGGGLIWAVRIVGGRALGQEAMGFGDVTLMAMIGSFLGWQATLVIFFLAPIAALFISVAQWLLTGRRDIAFGPYLCLAALFVMLRWGSLWKAYVGQIFSLGWYVPGMVGFCLMLMWALLTIMRFLRERLLGDETEEWDEAGAASAGADAADDASGPDCGEENRAESLDAPASSAENANREQDAAGETGDNAPPHAPPHAGSSRSDPS